MSEIIFNPSSAGNLPSQIENLQTTLASLNQRVIILQEALQERDQEISELKMKQATKNSDTTLTIIGALVNLYKFVFPPGKME